MMTKSQLIAALGGKFTTKKLVAEVFDSKVQSKRLNEYLKELCG